MKRGAEFWTTRKIGVVESGRHRLLGFVTVAMSGVALSALGLAIFATGSNTLDPWVVVSVMLLTIVATHREEVFGDETAINGSMVVLLAAAGIAVAGGPLWVAGACGLVGGLGWQHMRDRAARKIVVNASVTTLATLAAAIAGRAIDQSGLPTPISLCVTAITAVIAYWLVDNFLIALIISIVRGGRLRTHMHELVRSETELLPFAALGFLSGYVFQFETWAAIAAIIALLLIVDPVLMGRHVTPGLRLSARLTISFAMAAVPFVALVLFGAAGEAAGVTLMIVVTLTLSGAVLLERTRPGLCPLAGVAGTTTAALVFHAGAPVFAPLVVGVGLALLATAARRSFSTRVSLAGAAGLGALAIGITVGLFSEGLAATPGGCLAAGIAGSLAGLLAWHVAMGSALVAEAGFSAWPVAFGMLRGDLGVFAAGGLMGAACGWVGIHVSTLAMVGVFASLIGLSWFLARRRATSVSVDAVPGLDDEELLDVVRSALLELPASTPPGRP